MAGNCCTSIAIREDRTLFAWGDTFDPLPVGTFLAIDGSTDHFLGLRTDGSLVFWGLSATPLQNLPGGTFRAVSTGQNHAVAIRTDGSLVQWGVPMVCPAGNDFIAVAAGEYATFSFALRSSGMIEAWGDPGFGVLNVPPGIYTAVVAGVWFGAALRTDGTIATWGQPLAAPLTGTFMRIAAGNGRVIGIRTDGTLAQSSLSFPVPAGTFVAIGAGNSHYLAITDCYANCDLSTNASVLNVNDFVCFLSTFAAGDPYANCDGGTSPPVLNVNDFVCFLGRFAAGCP